MPPNLVSPGIREAMVAYSRLMIAEATPWAEFRLPRDLPPTRPTLNACLLFVIEQLDHWDPTKKGLDWTAAFRLQPQPTPWPPELAPRGMDRDEAVIRLEGIVAPLAKLLGLWNHRNLASNLAEHARAPERFRAVVNKLCDPAVAHLTDAYRRQIEAKIRRETFWTYHHPGSLVRRIGEQAPLDAKHLRFGFVAVPIGVEAIEQGRDKTWLLVARLHKHFEHNQGGLRDYFSRATSGYAALHTEVLVGEERMVVPVSVEARGSQLRGAALMERMLEALHRLTPERVHVYTPMGDRMDLPWGATVLNFAAAIHSEVAAKCKGAWMDGRWLEPLDQVESGRQVTVETADGFVPPPDGWERRVPPETTALLQHVFRPYFEEADIKAGRDQVRAHALQEHQLEDLDDADIDHALVEALRQQGWERTRSTDTESARVWLRRLAIAGEQRLNPKQRLHLLDTICRILGTKAVAFPSLVIPDKYRDWPVRWCQECNPAIDGHLFGERRAGQLLLHRADDAPCSGPRCFAIRRRFRHRFRQWVEVDTVSRSGMTASLMDVFRDQLIDFGEIVARHTVRDRGFFRVEVRPLRLDRQRALSSKLRQVHGVIRVRFLSEEQRGMLSPELPPPRLTTESTSEQAYIVGAPVYKPEHFYGRERDVKELLRMLLDDYAEVSDAFVTGPFRVGKSSVMHRVRHELGRDPLAVVVYLQAHDGEAWPAFAPRLAQQLRRAGEAWVRNRRLNLQLPPASEGAAAIVTALRATRSAPRVILMIDEGVGLVAATEALSMDPRVSAPKDNPWARLQREVDELRNLGARLAWAGPPPPQTLTPDADQSLQGTAGFFTRCRSIRLEPFTEWRLVQALLCVEQGAAAPPREISPGNARHVLTLTGGEPLWIQALGRELEQVVSGRVLVFDRPAIQRAAERLLSQHDLFHPRTARNGKSRRWRAGIDGQQVWQLLMALAKLIADGDDVTTEALAMQTAMHPDMAEHLLHEMTRMGTVRMEELRPCWAFACPLLGRYVGRLTCGVRFER